MFGQIPTQDTQLQSLVDYYSIEDNLDHLRNVEVPSSFFSHSKVKVWAKIVVVVVVLGK